MKVSFNYSKSTPNHLFIRISQCNFIDTDNNKIYIKDEAPSDNDDENEGNMRGSQMRETSLANLELGDRSGNLNSTTNDDQSANKEVKPKRKIAKQPLLNADRVLGKRGIRELEKIFRDFEPRGI